MSSRLKANTIVQNEIINIYKMLQKMYNINISNRYINNYHDITVDIAEKYINDSIISWSNFGKNPNITLDFVKKHRNKHFNWKQLSKNPGISFKDFTENPELPWKLRELSINPNMPLVYAETYLDNSETSNLKINYENYGSYIYNLISSHDLPIYFYEKYKKIFSNWGLDSEYIVEAIEYAKNYGIPNDDLKKIIYIYKCLRGNRNTISNTSEITTEFLEKYCYLLHDKITLLHTKIEVPIPLNLAEKVINKYTIYIEDCIVNNKYYKNRSIYSDYLNILYNWNLPVEIIEKYKNSLEWDELSKNKYISLNLIEATIDYPWNFENIFINNKNITQEFIMKHIQKLKGRSLFRLSKSKNININIILNNLNLDWSFNELSKNPGIYAKDIMKTPLLPWISKEIASNPNVTLELLDMMYRMGLKNRESGCGINWYAASRSPNILMEDIEKSKLFIREDIFDWKYTKSGILSNPNLTTEFVKKNLHRFGNSKDVIKAILTHPYQYEKNLIIDKLEKRYIIINKRIELRYIHGKRDSKIYFPN